MSDAGHKARQRMVRKALRHFGGRGPSSLSGRRIPPWPIWIVGALALALSFLITLWLTRPAKPPADSAVRSMTSAMLDLRRTEQATSPADLARGRTGSRRE
jgi:hypothetical protein